MNENNNKPITEQEFKAMLRQSDIPESSKDLTDRIMLQIEQVEYQETNSVRSKKLAWIFSILAVILSMKVMVIYSSAEVVFAKWLNSLLPGLSDSLVYLVILAISALILYELNLLMTQRFSKLTEKPVFE